MSNLTKEECMKALESVCNDCNAEVGCDIHAIYKCHERNIFEQLINEHFDNPPLEFEELKPNMWIWVDGLKYYYKIKEIITNYRNLYVEVYDGGGDSFMIRFKNDFYTKEVKDDVD